MNDLLSLVVVALVMIDALLIAFVLQPLMHKVLGRG